MDVLGLLKEVSGLGIDSVIVGAVVLLAVRYWISELRRDISKEIDDKVGSAKSDLEQMIRENRQEIAAHRAETRQEFTAVRTDSRKEFDVARTYSEESHKETRQEIHAVRVYAEQAHQETRQEIRETRADSSQAHKETRQEMKEIMLHLIDVRERLANIEGRLGAPTPRMSAVSPPLESPAEEPSAQS